MTTKPDKVIITRTAVNTTYSCPHCNFHVTVRKGQQGAGKGAGLRNGSLSRSKVIRHVNTQHRFNVATRLEGGGVRMNTVYAATEAEALALARGRD